MQRQCILNGGGMRGLEHLLQARETPRQEAAVEALAALTMGNADVLDTIIASREGPCHCSSGSWACLGGAWSLSCTAAGPHSGV